MKGTILKLCRFTNDHLECLTEERHTTFQDLSSIGRLQEIEYTVMLPQVGYVYGQIL